MALCPSRLYTKYSKQTKEEVGGDFRGGGEAHGNITRTVYVFHLTIYFLFPYSPLSGSTDFHYKFATTGCGPPHHPPPHSM